MSEATDEDLPPLGESTSPRRTAPGSPAVRRRTAVAAAVALLSGLGAGFAVGRGLDDDIASNSGRPPPGNSATAGVPPTPEQTLPPDCVDTMRSAQQTLALVEQALRDVRNLNLGEVDRAAREVDRLRTGLDEEVRRCFEQMGD